MTRQNTRVQRPLKMVETLWEAAKFGNAARCTELLASGFSPHERSRSRLWSPLHWAAHCGHEEVCQVLLEAGAPTEIHGKNEETPLVLAAAAGHARICRLLLEAGANHDVFVRLGNDKNPSLTALGHAIQKGHLETCRVLLEAGADVDAKPNYYPMHPHPLALAAESGHIACCRILVEHGVNLEQRYSSMSLTALHRAAATGYTEVCECLLSAGASIDAQDYRGLTPLHHAVIKGQEEVCRLLLAKGADLAATNYDGATSLHMAAEFGRTGVCALLINAGLGVNEQDPEGRTPLHCVGRRIWDDGLNEKVLCHLLAAGADETLRDNNGLTPLELAHPTIKDRLTAQLEHYRLNAMTSGEEDQGEPELNL